MGATTTIAAIATSTNETPSEQVYPRECTLTDLGPGGGTSSRDGFSAANASQLRYRIVKVPEKNSPGAISKWKLT